MVVYEGLGVLVVITGANDSNQFRYFKEIYDAFFLINPHFLRIDKVDAGHFDFCLLMIDGSYSPMSHFVLITMVQAPKKMSLILKQQLHPQNQVKNFSLLSQTTIHLLVSIQMTLIYTYPDLFMTSNKITEQNSSLVFQTFSFLFASLIYDDLIYYRLRQILKYLLLKLEWGS